MLNFSSAHTPLHFKLIPYSGWSPNRLPISFLLVLPTVSPSAQHHSHQCTTPIILTYIIYQFFTASNSKHLSICTLASANQMVQQCKNLQPLCLQHDPSPVRNTCFSLCLILSPFINCTVFIFTAVSCLPKTSLKLLHIPEIYAQLHPWNVASSGNE